MIVFKVKKQPDYENAGCLYTLEATTDDILEFQEFCHKAEAIRNEIEQKRIERIKR